tara:strand:+ start:2001 stop:3095 length:1095 start_codon:yes stop_codon:yes gene_type:complete
MKVDGKPYRTIWLAENGRSVKLIDQTQLPHEFKIVTLETLDDAVHAIRNMLVRGAPLIGATSAYGICLAVKEESSDEAIRYAYDVLLTTRPTAVNLRKALDQMYEHLMGLSPEDRMEGAYSKAADICNEDIKINELIGLHGLRVIEEIGTSKTDGEFVNILTHCNAGWLATVDKGTALSPVYRAHDMGIPVHVWVDETRPRNQGASLTAWELDKYGVPYTVVTDNVGGHLMQHGMVDICLVGSDRTTASGDVCNKIGTYLKALAAKENNVPFYVALPSPTIDWDIQDGLQAVPIEQRDAKEVSYIRGKDENGDLVTVSILPEGSQVVNYSFDVTPAKYVTGLITEKGVCSASREGLLELFSEEV